MSREFKGLTQERKELLKDLMGSASSKNIDMNKVREWYKEDCNEAELKMIAGIEAVKFYKNTGMSFDLFKEGLLKGFTVDDFNKLHNYYIIYTKDKNMPFNKYMEIILHWEDILNK